MHHDGALGCAASEGLKQGYHSCTVQFRFCDGVPMGPNEGAGLRCITRHDATLGGRTGLTLDSGLQVASGFKVALPRTFGACIMP